jgi:mono/diheme cytochrome c family protein
MLKGAVVVFAALAACTVTAAAQTQLERGDYLVNAVMGCDGCHTPRGPAGFDMSKRFSGGSQVWDEPAYWVKGSNISSDAETGIGKWSADDLKRLLTDGMRPTGVPVAPQMPFAFYKILTPRDLDAVVTYVRSLAPVRNEVPPPVYKAEMHAPGIPDGDKPMPEEAFADPVKRGFYLATIAHCMECHARKPDGTQDHRNWLGKGGHEMKGPFGSVTVRNITSHKTAGIGGWTNDEIKKALTQGVGRDGRAFKLPMARHIYYSRLTEADLNAIVAWVRTLPPLE